MKKFLSKITLFFLALISLIFFAIVCSSHMVQKRNFENYTSESNTLFLNKKTEYDILFLGISHARNFSRHKNHLRIERILENKIINLGQGGGICGVNEQLFYLDYFFSQGHQTTKIIYVLSPPMLFSETLPLASNTFNDEVFEISFLFKYLSFNSENRNERLMSYLQTKLQSDWLFKQPITLESMETRVDSFSQEEADKGQDLAYGGSTLNFERFDKAIHIVEQTIQLAKKNEVEIIFLIPPALFGKWRGHEETLDFANVMKEKYKNITVFDASETVLEPELYYDYHHLNTKGIIHFTEKYLKPVLE